MDYWSGAGNNPTAPAARPQQGKLLCYVAATLPRHDGEIDMADDKSKPGGQDRTRINVNEDHELRDWSKKFGVTPEQLKAAVKTVGTSAAAVEAHLKKG